MASSPTQSDSAQVVVIPPPLYAGALAAGLLLHWWKPVHPFPSWTRWLGALLLVAAALELIWGRRTLTGAGTNVRPDQPTTTIVTDGPYRYTRNPLYVGLTGVYLGVSLAVNALWPLVLLIPTLLVMQWGVVAREERYLEKKFGETYLAYKRRVRRWL